MDDRFGHALSNRFVAGAWFADHAVGQTGVVLCRLDFNASFSHNGDWIVFTSMRNGSPDINRAHPTPDCCGTACERSWFAGTERYNRQRALASGTPPFYKGVMGMPETLIILVAVIGLAGTAFWIWALIDCATNESNTGNDKIVWVIIIALTHFIGAAIYLFVRRPRRLAEAQR
jgi:hypothetical protein